MCESFTFSITPALERRTSENISKRYKKAIGIREKALKIERFINDQMTEKDRNTAHSEADDLLISSIKEKISMILDKPKINKIHSIDVREGSNNL